MKSITTLWIILLTITNFNNYICELVYPEQPLIVLYLAVIATQNSDTILVGKWSKNMKHEHCWLVVLLCFALQLKLIWTLLRKLNAQIKFALQWKYNWQICISSFKIWQEAHPIPPFNRTRSWQQCLFNNYLLKIA